MTTDYKNRKNGSEKYEFVFDDEVIKKIAIAIGKYEPDLYKWNIPSSITEKFKFKPTGKNLYEKTISLRKWAEEQNLKTNPNLCEWIVKDWGKIKTNKNLKDDVGKAFKAHDNTNDEFNFERIASWSKVLAFQYPKTRAIYDARAIYSLNWLLLADSKKFLPMSNGQNSLLKLFSYENLLYFKILNFEGVMNEFEKDLKVREGKKKNSKLVGLLYQTKNLYSY